MSWEGENLKTFLSPGGICGVSVNQPWQLPDLAFTAQSPISSLAIFQSLFPCTTPKAKVAINPFFFPHDPAGVCAAQLTLHVRMGFRIVCFAEKLLGLISIAGILGDLWHSRDAKGSSHSHQEKR